MIHCSAGNCQTHLAENILNWSSSGHCDGDQRAGCHQRVSWCTSGCCSSLCPGPRHSLRRWECCVSVSSTPLLLLLLTQLSPPWRVWRLEDRWCCWWCASVFLQCRSQTCAGERSLETSRNPCRMRCCDHSSCLPHTCLILRILLIHTMSLSGVCLVWGWWRRRMSPRTCSCILQVCWAWFVCISLVMMICVCRSLTQSCPATGPWPQHCTRWDLMKQRWYWPVADWLLSWHVSSSSSVSAALISWAGVIPPGHGHRSVSPVLMMIRPSVWWPYSGLGSTILSLLSSVSSAVWLVRGGRWLHCYTDSDTDNTDQSLTPTQHSTSRLRPSDSSGPVSAGHVTNTAPSHTLSWRSMYTFILKRIIFQHKIVNMCKKFAEAKMKR